MTEEGRLMAAEHDDHGNTPAAWTLVVMIIVGFTVGGVGMVFANIPVFVAGVVICVLGAITGKVMSMAGMGKQSETSVNTAS